MRHLMILSAVMFCCLSISFASTTKDLFEINEEMVYAEMYELNELEAYISNNGATMTDLTMSNSSLVSNVVSSNGIMSLSGINEPVLGIPSFIWGCCLGIPGLAIVYFVAEDNAETKKALWGCIVANVLYGSTYLIYYLVFAMYYLY